MGMMRSSAWSSAYTVKVIPSLRNERVTWSWMVARASRDCEVNVSYRPPAWSRGVPPGANISS